MTSEPENGIEEQWQKLGPKNIKYRNNSEFREYCMGRVNVSSHILNYSSSQSTSPYVKMQRSQVFHFESWQLLRYFRWVLENIIKDLQWQGSKPEWNELCRYCKCTVKRDISLYPILHKHRRQCVLIHIITVYGYDIPVVILILYLSCANT